MFFVPLEGLRQVTYLAIILRIICAVAVGGLIGLERGMKNRPAGLRTYMLVCVGSCLIMLTNQYLYQVSGAGDPMRLGAQVVSGIGFLGAGTIIVTKHTQIKGLTTAAGLWASAGVGLALGVGFYEAALVAGLAVFFVLTGLQKLDNRMRSKTRTLEVYIEIADSLNIGALVRSVRDMNVEIEDIQLEHDTVPEDGARSLIATLKCKKRTDHKPLMDKIRKIEGVIYLEEL
ncbi:MAG: MgtC/SapB family protein [Ruminococcaceae bacterium]|nr:MgtC/SapB family protein [Oscillospiraceae bacterium]